MSAIVTVDHVAKRFGRTRVLEDVSFELPARGVTVLLGENGQGKSTLLRLLLGLLKAEAGSIRVLGLDPVRDGRELRQLVGYVPDAPDNPAWMTPRELYRFLRPQYPRWNQERVERLSATWKIPLVRKFKELSRGQPYDFTGVKNHDHLTEAGGLQWPWTETDAATAGSLPPARERRLFSDGRFFTPRRRAKFLFDEPRPMPEMPDGDFPLLLLTGRGTSAQWHTGSRTGKSGVLRKLAPTSLYVEMNPADATHRKIRAGDKVRVWSRRGEATATAVLTSTVQAGQIFMPMHFDEVNRLTYPAYDPHSRQPSYKACAVALERAARR